MYITVLHQLNDTCGYRDLKNEMICDCLIVGIRDTVMSERLQLEKDLDLDKAIKIIRHREAVKEQQGHLHGDGSKEKPIMVDEL